MRGGAVRGLTQLHFVTLDFKSVPKWVCAIILLKHPFLYQTRLACVSIMLNFVVNPVQPSLNLL